MDRRKFLKLVGAIGTGTACLAQWGDQGAYKFSVPDIEGLREDSIPRGPKQAFVAVAHPDYAYQVRVMSAKEEYKHADHVRRWEKRYGQRHPAVKGELGTINGVRWT